MKIKMLKNVVVDRQPQKVGNIIDVDEDEAMELIGFGDAIEATEEPKKQSGRPKKK